jgi:hypothetical protein
MWVALSAEPTQKLLASRWGASGNRAWQMLYDATSNQIRFLCSTDGVATLGTAAYDFDTDGISLASFFDGNPHHIAVVRNGSTITVYVDGDPGAATINIGGSSIFNGGTNYTLFGGGVSTTSQSLASSWTGYIDELRVSNSARYTGGFSPPTSSFSNDANTLSLCNFEGNFGVTQSGIVTNPLVLVNYANALSLGPFTEHGLMGKSSFTYPYVTSSPYFGFNSENFTIELFGMRNVGVIWGTSLRQLAGCWSTTAGQRAWRIILSTSTTFQFEYSLDGTNTAGTITFTGVSPVADTDYNLTVVRKESVLYLYCNGVLTNTAAISGSLFDPNSIGLPLGILTGASVSFATANSCATTTRIRGIRTLKGTARFTQSSYIVPSFPLP